MKILALEGSSSRRSVALLEGSKVIASASRDQHRPDPTLALIDECLKSAGWQPSDVERIAIGIGPGSYTGIRGSIATAMGWHLAMEVPVVAIDSFSIIVEGLRQAGITGRILVCADAQRTELCHAGFEITPTGVQPLHSFTLCPVTEIPALAGAGWQLYGPDLPRLAPMVRPAFPSAIHLGVLAETAIPVSDVSTLAAIHLRETTFVKAPPPRIPAEEMSD